MNHGLWIAAAVTIGFAALARALRGVTTSGAVAGGLVCFALYAGTGPPAFAALVSVFVITWAATRLGYQRKQHLGLAEKRGGRRASQVLANLSVAALCSIGYAAWGRGVFLLGLAASLAEAAADTVSSEVGQAQGKTAHLITTWEIVAAGTDGGVSLQGTAAGVLAAFFVGAVTSLGHMLSWRQALAAAFAAVVGMLADSYLGAIFERKKRLNNDLVNLLSTAVAAAIAMAVQ